jgi:hypothetical protein
MKSSQLLSIGYLPSPSNDAAAGHLFGREFFPWAIEAADYQSCRKKEREKGTYRVALDEPVLRTLELMRFSYIRNTTRKKK